MSKPTMRVWLTPENHEYLKQIRKQTGEGPVTSINKIINEHRDKEKQNEL